MFDSDRPLPKVGLLFAAVAIVGTAAFGWRFGGDSGAVPTALGVAAVAIAVAATLREKLR